MSEDSSHTAARPSVSIATWITLAVAALLILGWTLYLRPKLRLEQATKNAAVGQLLPVLELAPLTGVEHGVSLDDVRGKVTLINYWGTWCGPCIAEFPHLLELWDRYRGKPDFLFLSVSSTFADREAVDAVREETQKFLNARNTKLPTYIDADGISRQMLAAALGRPGLGYPTTVLLDRDATIRAVWEGYQPGVVHEMERMISALLAEKADR